VDLSNNDGRIITDDLFVFDDSADLAVSKPLSTLPETDFQTQKERQLVNKSPAFHGTKWFIPYSLQPANVPYPEQDESNPHPPNYSQRPSLISTFHLHPDLMTDLQSGFPTKVSYATAHIPVHAACPTHLILHDFTPLILFGEEYVKSTKSGAPQCAIFSTSCHVIALSSSYYALCTTCM
jgi:hypothetical protein